MKTDDEVKLPLSLKIASAGLAGCTADLVTFPFDTIKVWLMVRGESSAQPKPIPGGMPSIAGAKPSMPFSSHGAIHKIMTNVRQNGYSSLYGGLSAGLQRQVLFCGVRIGFYDHIKNFYMRNLPDTPQSIAQRILASLTSGCLAVVMFQPTDVVKIRMQADRTRYRSSIHAYRSIYKIGGLQELWKGVGANCARLAIVNACELVTYDIAKESIIKRKLMEDGFPCHFVSALFAGLVTTVVANPVDVIKTRYMNSEKGTYKNPIQCAAQLVKNEGMSAFYKGFLPSYVRIGFWNLVMFVSYEQYKKFSNHAWAGKMD